MTALSEPVSAGLLLEILERERRYYEVLRSVAKDQRAALAGGRPSEVLELLEQEEAQVDRARDTSEERLVLEAGAGSPGPAEREAQAEAAMSLRLFAAENRQNLDTAKRRLEEIHLSLAALNPSEEKPSYPGAAPAPAGAGPSFLDRKA